MAKEFRCQIIAHSRGTCLVCKERQDCVLARLRQPQKVDLRICPKCLALHMKPDLGDDLKDATDTRLERKTKIAQARVDKASEKARREKGLRLIAKKATIVAQGIANTDTLASIDGMIEECGVKPPSPIENQGEPQDDAIVDVPPEPKPKPKKKRKKAKRKKAKKKVVAPAQENSDGNEEEKKPEGQGG